MNARVLVIDDLRSFMLDKVPVDADVTYARTSDEGTKALRQGIARPWDQVWFDHDLGEVRIDGVLELDTTRPCALWMADPENPIVARSVLVHTASSVGSPWLLSTLERRYPVTARVNARDYMRGGF